MKQGDSIPGKFVGWKSSWPHGKTYMHIYYPMTLRG